MQNTSIRIIDSNFNLLGEIDDYESLIFIRRFYKVGEFELHININKNNVDMLKEDNLIIVGNNVKKVGVIRHKEIKLDEHGEATETLSIKGYTLKGILGRRIIIPPVGQGYENAIGSQEAIMKQFVYNNVVNPADINRRIPQVTIAPNQNRGKEDKWRGRFEKLTDKLQEIGEYAELGWDIYLDIDNNKWAFDVIEGKNLTANQEILPPVIFSVDFDNIKGQTYIDSALNYSNVGYAAGKGEEENRLIQQMGEFNGLDRIESFLDCSNAEDIVQLKEQGEKKLTELKRIQTFESQVIDFGSFVYMQDWDLGDIVTAQNRKWNLTMDARIVEVKEIYEVNGFNLEVVFGNNIPTIIDKIKKLEQQKLVEAKTGISGTDGKNGLGIQYAWNGTQLGVKKENEQNYNYVNLQGPQGLQGIQGLSGPKGDKGNKGDTGPKGDTGLQGPPGRNGIDASTKPATRNSLGGIKVGANLNITEDGILNGNDKPGCITIKQETFTVKANQTVFNITKGTYNPNTNSIFWYMEGNKQSNDVLEELSSTTFGIKGGLEEGTEILVEYIETVNVTVGLKGEKGDTGERGAQGIKGDKGDKGDTGSQGIQGPKGDRGDTGQQGLQGIAGKDGSDANVTKSNVVNALGYTPSDGKYANKAGALDKLPTNPTKPIFFGPAGISSVLGDDMVFRKLSQLRFSDSDDWDWNSWAGIKYDSESKTVYIGGPGGVFTGNSNPPAITIDLTNQVNEVILPLNTKINGVPIATGGGMNIVASATEPSGLNVGDWWYKE